jgi:hypothetical protein
MDNQGLHLTQSVLVVSQVRFASHVKSALLNMIMAMVSANLARTNQLTHTTTKQLNTVISALISALRVLRMFQ